MSTSVVAFDRPRFEASNAVFKSGPLFISSKALGWKSWKKRWFILTRTSLVFFKNNPSALPQRDGEVNLTLGGIDLNNSGSVVVREDKKLLTVLFPEGRDGRAFTLKVETLEELYEWKMALEHALAEAPSAALVMGHNGIFRDDANDTIDGSSHQWRDKCPVRSMVVGQSMLLALEDVDGGPSFLEKALQFLENYGTKVEGILRQSADVEEVDRRIQEYEKGKSEFAPDEDAHVVGDCVKHVLRELASSPVPAFCCTALLEAYKIDPKEARVNALRSAILETFPEPNKRLLQRILKMMRTISLHVSENRMNPSAVAACMAPLLLRPLLAGECELENDYDVTVGKPVQLFAAASAANAAQAIITILLEEYENVFCDDNLYRCCISADSWIENSRSEDSTNEENLDIVDHSYQNTENQIDLDTGGDHNCVVSGKLHDSIYCADDNLYKAFGEYDADVGSPKSNLPSKGISNLPVDSQSLRVSNIQVNGKQGHQKASKFEMDSPTILPHCKPHQSMGETPSSMNQGLPLSVAGAESCIEKSINKPANSIFNIKQSKFWGRGSARKTPSMESIDSSVEEELAIQRLEITKNELQHKIAKEAKENTILQASMERRKQALNERRLALEHDVARLQDELQAERDLHAALEVGLNISFEQFPSSVGMDSKTRAELEEIALAEADVARLKQKIAGLHHQLNQQRLSHYGSLPDAYDFCKDIQNHNSQPKYFLQDFDTTLAFVNDERKQGTEGDLSGAAMRNATGQVLMCGSIRHPARMQFMDSASISDLNNAEPCTSTSMDGLNAIDFVSLPSTSVTAEVMNQSRSLSAASSALVELTTLLDHFKERKSQLMEQLHSLSLNCGPESSQGFAYKSSPAWI